MRILAKVAVFVVIAALSNLAGVLALPWAINWKVKRSIAAQGGVNVAIPAPRADAKARAVVRPSPDLLYTACVYDVSESPLYVHAPVPDGYLSIAGFADDTTNFFAVNDSHAQAGVGGAQQLELVIAGRKRPNRLPYGVQVFNAPSERGLVLFRMLPSDADLPRLRDEFQGQQQCQPL